MAAPQAIFQETMDAVIAMVVLGALFSYSAANVTAGPFAGLLDLLGAVAAFVVDPSVILLLFAVGFVFNMLSGGRGVR